MTTTETRPAITVNIKVKVSREGVQGWIDEYGDAPDEVRESIVSYVINALQQNPGADAAEWEVSAR